MTNKTRHCIIVHYDEIAIKLGNRPWFERQLVQNIKNQLKDLNYATVQKFSARIFINEIDSKKSDLYLEKLQNVMGVSSVHSMISVLSDIDTIKKNYCYMKTCEKRFPGVWRINGVRTMITSKHFKNV